jgi:hypothetical protein
VALGGVLVYYLVLMVEQQALGNVVAWFPTVIYLVIPSAVLNAVIMPPFYWLLIWLHRGVYPRLEAEW